eukprot:scaffold11682_cov148-Skeletonema_dohrnii-CCMP3373.AAC.5
MPASCKHDAQRVFPPTQTRWKIVGSGRSYELALHSSPFTFRCVAPVPFLLRRDFLRVVCVTQSSLREELIIDRALPSNR